MVDFTKLFFSLIPFRDCLGTPAAKQKHLQDTLSGYGRSVVREMRALAAERDKSELPPTVDENGKPLKLKNKKKKVAHIVDKMLFNYRNIGKQQL